MQPPNKFAFDVSITFAASVISMLIGFVITVLLGKCLEANDLGLYQMTSTIYGVQTITYPATSEYWNNNINSASQMMMDKSMIYTACVLLPTGLGDVFRSDGVSERIAEINKQLERGK